MPAITFIPTNGAPKTINAATGQSLMQAATMAGISEILAECGGNCMCATCHVIPTAETAALIPPLTDDEDALLDGTAEERSPTSRLSCQIQVTQALEGATFNLPARQA